MKCDLGGGGLHSSQGAHFEAQPHQHQHPHPLHPHPLHTTPTNPGRAAFAEPPSAARSWAGLRTGRAAATAAAAIGTQQPLYNLQPTPIVESETLALATTRGGASGAAAPAEGGMKRTVTVGSFFFLWYLFNIGYNIYNKKALNALPLPWTVGLIQLSLGLLYVFPLWLFGLRKVRVYDCACVCAIARACVRLSDPITFEPSTIASGSTPASELLIAFLRFFHTAADPKTSNSQSQQTRY
jgi:hypothetical protein